MSNEEIKAPVIPGFEICSHVEWLKKSEEDSAHFRIGIYDYYYKRIKPKEKEKSMREVAESLYILQVEKDPINVTVFFIEKILEYVDSNYVKKEG